jgi:hypothetical protein
MPFVAKLMIRYKYGSKARLAFVDRMYTSWFSNFSVYYDNLSVYYVCTIVLSFLAVFVTWWLLDSDRKHPEDDKNNVGPAHTY